MALTQKPQILDALSLFSLKVGPNIFDISSSMQHVSIRDQIVRGQLVIRDLLQADPQTRSILIVGCGAAGASAALAASSAGVDQVLVVDAQLQTFSLLRGVTSRYVGPFMYEWPSSLYKDQSYPSPLATRSYVAAPELSWTSAAPCQADDLARLLEKSFATSIKSLVTDLTVALGVDAGKISNFVKSFNQGKPSRMPLFVPGPYALQTHASRSRYSGHLPVRIQPDYIVLAGGMGKENCWLLGGTTAANDHRGIAFWDNDHLLAANSANLKIAIFGGGDGALQDVLRALTGFDHPLDFIGKLERDPRMKTAISCIKPELLSLDRQSRKLSTWTADNTVFQVIDRKCRLLAEKLATLIGVRKNVLKNIRKGSGAVWLFVREDHFGKAYLLNRFLVHLLAACVNYRGAKPTAGRMELTICFNSTATEYSSLPATGSIGTGHQKHRIGVLDGAGSRNMDFDEVVVRYGIEKGSVPGAQMIQLSKKPSAQRTVLNRIELPFVVE